jgi:hypothetical protein
MSTTKHASCKMIPMDEFGDDTAEVEALVLCLLYFLFVCLFFVCVLYR